MKTKMKMRTQTENTKPSKNGFSHPPPSTPNPEVQRRYGRHNTTMIAMALPHKAPAEVRK